MLALGKSGGPKRAAFVLALILGLTALPPGGATASDDTLPPTTLVTRPAPGDAGWYTHALTLHVEPQDEGGSGVSHTYVRVGTAFVIRYGAAPFDLPLHGDGTKAVTIYGVDNAGNVEAPIAFDVRVDTTQPTVELVAKNELLAGVWFEGETATLHAKATDTMSGVGHVEFHVWTTTGYTVVPGTLAADDAWVGAWDTSDLEPQIVEVTALAQDVAGNWAGSHSHQHLILPRA